MTYEIKSTPYFQRMLTTSKQNGQLQILKEEYERMNILNERNIEMKMRKVQLSRLFKEIEEIKNRNLKRHRRFDPKERPKTKETERLENLKKARNLGQYFSRRNLEDAELGTNKKSLRKKLKTDAAKPQSFVYKRNLYGNKISDWNLQKIKKNNLRKDILACHGNVNINNQTNSKRSFYIGNNFYIKRTFCNSPNNSKINNTNDCIDLQIDGNSNAKTSVLTLSENIHLINLEPIDDNFHLKSCDKIHEVMLIDESIFKSKRAAEHWRKLVTLTKAHFGMNQPSKAYDPTSDQIKFVNKQISASIATALSETDIKPINSNERLKSKEYIFDRFSTTLPSMITFMKNKFLKASMKPQDDAYCHQPIEPFSMDYEQFSVGKIRQSFENYN